MPISTKRPNSGYRVKALDKDKNELEKIELTAHCASQVMKNGTAADIRMVSATGRLLHLPEQPVSATDLMRLLQSGNTATPLSRLRHLRH